MKILLAKDKGIEADVFSLALESFFQGLKVDQADSARDALAILQKPDADYVAILAENRFQDGESSLDLYKFVLSKPDPTPFLLISDSPVEKLPYFAARPPTAVIRRPIDVAKMLELVGRYAFPDQSSRVPDYCRISISLLLLSDESLKTDLYIKLSEEKFVRALPEGSVFDLGDYNRFLQKKLHHLYVRREDLIALIDRWVNKFQELENADLSKMEVGQISDYLSSAHNLVQSALPIRGFTPELQQLTLSCVDLAVKTIRQSPTLSALLDSLHARKIPYISAHSTALAFVASKLAFLMDWHSDRTFFKLSAAAFLHDITLAEDEWARLQTKEEIAASGLSEEMREKITRHPLEAAELAREMGDLSADIEHILQQHHEQSDGSGFPRNATNKEISQISALFVLAHDMVLEMYRLGEKFDGSQFFRKKEICDKFDRGSFSRVYRSLRSKIDEEAGP